MERDNSNLNSYNHSINLLERKTLVITGVKKIDNSTESKSDKLFMLKLKSQKHETFSFNIKNARNAIVFELPVDEKFYNEVKKGQKLKSQDVYTEALDIIPEFFSEIAITVEGKRITKKK